MFEFGFDSLKLVRLASQLRRFYGLKPQDVLLGELIYTLTIDNIATIIDRIRAGTGEETSEETSYVEPFTKEFTLEAHKALGADITESATHVPSARWCALSSDNRLVALLRARSPQVT